MFCRLVTASIITSLIYASAALASDINVIIGFRHQTSLADQDKQGKITGAGGRIKKSHRSINAISARIPEESLALIKNEPAVAYIEADSIVTAIVPPTTSPAPTPELLDSWGVMHIGAASAYAKGIKGAGVKVAILDTGIDYTHPDLSDNYKGGYNFVYDNNDPIDDSRYGHGTHVAGIIAAKDNGTGVVGVAPEASIYALKVLNGGLMGLTSDILDAIDWAITNKMNIINMSFGAPLESQAFSDVCDLAYKAGITIFAAAGNFKQPVVDNPAGFASVIAVSATNPDDTLAYFSNYGDKVEVAAPGVNIKSTVKGGGYGLMSGTSQSTPHAAGVAALIISAGIQDMDQDGNIADEVRKQLTLTATDLGAPGRDIYFGYGLVNAKAAVDLSRHFKLLRTQASPSKDAKHTQLQPGTYLVTASNNGLDTIMIRASEASIGNCYHVAAAGSMEAISDDAGSLAIFSFKKNHKESTPVTIKAVSTCDINMIPFGSAGTGAEITLSPAPGK